MAVTRDGIRGVVFDVDGTLVTLRASIGELYAEALQERGYKVDANALNSAALTEWGAFESEYLNTAEGYATQPSREVLVWCEFVRRVLRQAAPELSTQWDLLAHIYSYFSQGSSRRVVDGALEVCEALTKRGIAVIAATNNDQRTAAVMSDLGFNPSVSHIITAGELGWKKPSPHFFKGVAERVKLPLGELLHIGNDAQLDLVGAQQAGMQALLFDPHGRGQNPRIRALREVLDVIVES